ncbi:MAG: nuclear transport factor 2 family protein [Ekhidna sp.]|uniref:YybH family protein n=1 Tax=Ekhidna sp. TaxID=2608089 RepID=UPI0032EF251D
MKQLLSILFLLAFQSSLAQSADEQAIIEVSTQFSQYYVEGDIGSLAKCYTEDGKIMPPNADIIEGREAIEKRWTLPEGVTILKHKSTPVEIRVMGDTAYDVGRYEGTTRRADGSEVSWSGKYIIIWKKVDGEWKIHWDIWNR